MALPNPPERVYDPSFKEDLVNIIESIATEYEKYTGGAYGFRNWGLGIIDDETDCDELADEIIEQLSEHLAYEFLNC